MEVSGPGARSLGRNMFAVILPGTRWNLSQMFTVAPENKHSGVINLFSSKVNNRCVDEGHPVRMACSSNAGENVSSHPEHDCRQKAFWSVARSLLRSAMKSPNVSTRRIQLGLKL